MQKWAFCFWPIEKMLPSAIGKHPHGDNMEGHSTVNQLFDTKCIMELTVYWPYLVCIVCNILFSASLSVSLSLCTFHGLLCVWADKKTFKERIIIHSAGNTIGAAVWRSDETKAAKLSEFNNMCLSDIETTPVSFFHATILVKHNVSCGGNNKNTKQVCLVVFRIHWLCINSFYELCQHQIEA